MDPAITPYLILKNSILKSQNKLTDFLSLPKMFQNPYIGQIYIYKGKKIPTAGKKKFKSISGICLQIYSQVREINIPTKKADFSKCRVFMTEYPSQ